MSETMISDLILEKTAKQYATIMLTSVCLVREGQIVISCTPGDCENPFVMDPVLLENILNQPSGVYVFHDEDNTTVYYGRYPLSDEELLLFGPLSSSVALRPSDFREYASRHHIKDKSNFSINILSEQQLIACMNLFHLLTKSCTLAIIDEPELPFSTLPIQEQVRTYYIGKLDHRSHIPFTFEQKAGHYIVEGNYEGYKKLMADMEGFAAGKMADSYNKNEEYTAVLLVTGLVRRAIEAGVNPYEAYDINDLYLQRISRSSSPREYQTIMDEATKHIFSLIKALRSRSSRSLLVEKCKSYIARNLNKDFTVKDIAAHIGVTAEYLSYTFSQHEHMTIKKYILSEKISAAKNMLRFSDYKVSDISYYLNFCSQSYFCQCFKKETGMTPFEYRKESSRNL